MRHVFLAVGLALLVVACGGGDSSTPVSPTTTPAIEPTPTPTSAPSGDGGASTSPTVTPAPDQATAPTSTAASGTGTLQIRVTDAPTLQVSSILLTVSHVEVSVAGEETAESGWRTVVADPQTFDLVALRGVEEVLGSAELAPGTYGQVRLEVVEAMVTIGGEATDAKVPSGKLRFAGGFQVTAGQTTILTLDFDAEKSVVRRGRMDPLIKPVVKLLVRQEGQDLDEADEASEPAGDTVTIAIPQMVIAEVAADLPAYDRDDWTHWIDVDGDCQNARHEVLIEESVTAVSFTNAEECTVANGEWQAPFTDTTVTVARDLDVDHLVPLVNAHRSGGWAWADETKEDYANDLSFDNHLIAVTASANRSKGARGPEEWKPPFEGYWCEYALSWITVKDSWGLTATAGEWAALTEMLGTCSFQVSVEGVVSDGPTSGPISTAAPAATRTPTAAPAASSPAATPPPATRVATPTPRPTPTPPPTQTPTAAPPPTPVPSGQVVIDCIFYDGRVPRSEADEYVQISNRGRPP